MSTSVVALVGNPRPGSRTLAAAHALAELVAGRTSANATVHDVELAALAGELLAREHPAADAARVTVAAAGVLVVATPVYKASFTGLLKVFLDGYGPDGLAGVVAVPLVVTGSLAHSLVGEVHLRPVLVELGATVPTRSLVVAEAELADLDAVIDRWWQAARTPLLRAVGAPGTTSTTSPVATQPAQA